MQIIYNSHFTAAKKTPPQVAGSRLILCGYAVDAYAVLGINGQCTVEASNDNFATTVYSNTLTADGLVQISSVTAAKWRITAASGVTLGQLYIGTYLSITDPTHPYGFEAVTKADDRETQGGIGYSKIQHSKRRGQFNWHGIQEAEVAAWRLWHDATAGFRRGFVLQLPFSNELVLVRAPGSFPLRLAEYRNSVGSLQIDEML